MKLFQRVKAEFAQDGDFDTGNVKYKGYERYSVGWTDWRACTARPARKSLAEGGDPTVFKGLALLPLGASPFLHQQGFSRKQIICPEWRRASTSQANLLNT
jgi:hypothetical protein